MHLANFLCIGFILYGLATIGHCRRIYQDDSDNDDEMYARNFQHKRDRDYVSELKRFFQILEEKQRDAAPPEEDKTPCIEANKVDNFGPSVPAVWGASRKSAQECMQDCDRIPECKHWTYGINPAHFTYGLCYLKTKLVNQSASTNTLGGTCSKQQKPSESVKCSDSGYCQRGCVFGNDTDINRGNDCGGWCFAYNKNNGTTCLSDGDCSGSTACMLPCRKGLRAPIITTTLPPTTQSPVTYPPVTQPPPVDPYKCASMNYRHNTDLIDTGRGSENFRQLSYRECCNKCLQTSPCRGFTWGYPDNSNWEQRSRCWLKNGVGATSPLQGFISSWY